MDADQTYNSIVFVKSYDNKDESKRQSIARGINTPDVMYIRSQDYVDSTTKIAGKRYTCRVERHDLDVNNAKIISSFSFTFQVPSTAAGASITTLVATARAVIADADHIEDILNDEK
jgi:hypothetical protein